MDIDGFVDFVVHVLPHEQVTVASP